jgi:NADPH:quinone reductase-like Zn-dependent oxidoreductase
MNYSSPQTYQNHWRFSMKAIVCKKYGAASVLKLEEVAKPIPESNQVLVRVHAASVTAADIMMRRGLPIYGRVFIGLFSPKITTPGTGFSGTIEALGEGVKQFEIGDCVFGEVLFATGTNAEYVCVAQDELVFNKPNCISHIEAASIGDGLVTSLNFLTKVKSVKAGQRVLINGASGSLGTAGIQIAKQLGAHITGLCSGKNIELVSSLGADKVIDYTQATMTESLESYDVIYDAVGTLAYRDYKRYLKEEGVFVSPVLSLSLLWQTISSAIIGNKRAVFSATGLLDCAQQIVLFNQATLLIEQNKLRQVIDRTFALGDAESAHRYVETGRKVGNVVLVI